MDDTMSVFDKYKKGSFRDVPFLYVDSDGDLGRRKAVFEYPQGVKPYVEDMGRKARTFSMTLVVAGPDYMKKRDNLIEAFETKGSGILVHPTIGKMTVEVMAVRGPRESTQQGGTATFNVTFMESGEKDFLKYKPNTAASVSDKAYKVDTAAAVQLKKKLFLSDQLYLLVAAGEQLKEFTEEIKQSVSKYTDMARNNALTKSISDIHDAVQNITSSALDISNTAANLIRSPIDLYQSIQEIVSDIIKAATDPLSAFKALKDFWGYTGTNDTIPLTTTNRIIENENKTQLILAFNVAATSGAAQSASQADYASQQDADAIRHMIEDKIDDLCLLADVDLYNALMDLRAAVISDLVSRPGLPGLITVTMPEDIPALVLAYRLYADAEQAGDIVARNHIVHPGFLPGGRDLEVLDEV